jgi:hypothetical protein
VFVPAADLDKAKQEAAAAQAAQAATLKAEQTKEETYRSRYPGSLHFDYVWDEKKGKELGLQQIWRDDKFTYLRGQFHQLRFRKWLVHHTEGRGRRIPRHREAEG